LPQGEIGIDAPETRKQSQGYAAQRRVHYLPRDSNQDNLTLIHPAKIVAVFPIAGKRQACSPSR